MIEFYEKDDAYSLFSHLTRKRIFNNVTHVSAAFLPETYGRVILHVKTLEHEPTDENKEDFINQIRDDVDAGYLIHTEEELNSLVIETFDYDTIMKYVNEYLDKEENNS